MNSERGVPAMTPMAVATTAADAPKYTVHSLTSLSAANSIVASCVLSPSSAINTAANTVKKTHKVMLKVAPQGLSEAKCTPKKEQVASIESQPCHRSPNPLTFDYGLQRIQSPAGTAFLQSAGYLVCLAAHRTESSSRCYGSL